MSSSVMDNDSWQVNGRMASVDVCLVACLSCAGAACVRGVRAALILRSDPMCDGVEF